MTDDNSAGYPAPAAEPPTVPQAAPPPVSEPSGGGFDWLLESHQQSAPMAPLTDDIPAPIAAQPIAAQPRYAFPDPAAPAPAETPVQPSAPSPAVPVAAPPPQPFAWAPAAPVAAPPQTQQFPPQQFAPQQSPPQEVAPQQPLLPRTVEASSPTTGPVGLGPLTLERHHSSSRSANGPLDWISFVLAFLAPPIGLLAGIAATISDRRTKGFAPAIAKAAIAIGAVLSLVLGVALVVVGKIDADQAAHNAIVASSRAYCAKLQSNPATLSSDTFGWPSPGDTIPDSISGIQSYDSTWKSLVSVAPAGILADTKRVESAAAGILSSVKSTQTLDNASNVADMQDVVATTGIVTWVSDYCK